MSSTTYRSSIPPHHSLLSTNRLQGRRTLLQRCQGASTKAARPISNADPCGCKSLLRSRPRTLRFVLSLDWQDRVGLLGGVGLLSRTGLLGLLDPMGLGRMSFLDPIYPIDPMDPMDPIGRWNWREHQPWRQQNQRLQGFSRPQRAGLHGRR